MSAPQPPNQPWGGQPPQGPPGGPQDNPFGEPEPTQVVQPVSPQQPQGGGLFGESAEPTEVVQPPKPGETPPGEATQFVNPAGAGQGGDSTQLVPPGSQPPAIPYTPPPSAADNPNAVYGQQPPPGYGQQPAYGQPSFGGPGFGGPQQPGLGMPGGPAQPAAAPAGGASLFGYIAAGVLALFAVLSGIFFFVDMFDKDFTEYSDAVGASSDQTIQAAKDAGQYISPGALTIYYVVVLVGALVALGAAVLTFLKNKIASILAAGGGFLLLVAAILIMFEFSITVPDGATIKFGSGQILYLLAGIFVLAIGVLGLIPSTAKFVGFEGAAPAGPSGFGGPPPGYGQPPQGYGPPPGYGQPGGQNTPSGGFTQPGQPPQTPGGFPAPGQPPQGPGGYPPPGQPYGQPPQGYGPPPGQQGPPGGGFQPPQQW